MTDETQNNPFVLMGLDKAYSVDMRLLDDNYRQLMQKYHPDNFVNEPVIVKRITMQMSTRINEAYAHIKNPLSRAILWMKLYQLSKDDERTSSLPPEFLMQQIKWREKIDAADKQALAEIQKEIKEKLSDFEAEFNEISKSHFKLNNQGWACIEKWQFFDKLARVVDNKGQ